jgi:hypothetical protein
MIPGHTQRARVAHRGTLTHMTDSAKPPREPSTSELLEDWRAAERSATAAERAADAAERASEAAERAALAAERVAGAALVTLEAAQESLDVIRASVVEARAAASTSTTESAEIAEGARTAQDGSTASRERYQARVAEVGARKERAPMDRDEPAEKTDMNAIGDDGQVFGG